MKSRENLVGGPSYDKAVATAIYLLLTGILGGSVAMAQDSLTLIDFESPDARRSWRIVNDGVMGGLSRSQLVVTGAGTAVFQGTVSLENNGGFASVRTDPTDFQLAHRKGLSLRVKGDGKRYQLRLRTNGRFDGVAYTSSFDTIPGEWSTVAVEFSDFLPSFRGRSVPNAPELEPARIRQIGILIGDKQVGPFRLEIDSIDAYH